MVIDLRLLHGQKARVFMRTRSRKVNFAVLILLMISFFITLFREMDFYSMVYLYLFLGCAINDICFDALEKGGDTLRAGCWVVLNALIGVLFGCYLFFRRDSQLISGAVFLWALFCTLHSAFLLKKKPRQTGHGSDS